MSGTDSTFSTSNPSLSSCDATIYKSFSPNEKRFKMADTAAQNIKLEKCNAPDLQNICVISHLPLRNDNHYNEASHSTNLSISSDEINSYNSSDNCSDATATCFSKKAKRGIRRVSPRCKQLENDSKTLMYIDRNQVQGGKFLVRLILCTKGALTQ